jgi:hypothetical protein
MTNIFEVLNNLTGKINGFEMIDLSLDIMDYSDFPEEYKTISFNNKKIIGRIVLNIHKLEFINPCVLYIISSDDKCYIALDGTPEMLWYDITNSNEEDITILINSYRAGINRIKRIFLGTEAMIGGDLDDFDRMFIISKFTEGLTWGSLYGDYPFRDFINESERVSISTIGKMSLYALRQSPKMMSISSNTLYSNSIITIEYYNGVFIADIKYPSIIIPDTITVNYKNKIDNTLPIDVISFISNFPYLTCQELVDIKPFIKEYITIATLICNTKDLIFELKPYLERIIKEVEDEDVIESSKEILDNINTKNQIDELLHNKKFYEYLSVHIEDKKKNLISKEEYLSKTMDLIQEYQINIHDENTYEQLKRIVLSFIK